MKKKTELQIIKSVFSLIKEKPKILLIQLIPLTFVLSLFPLFYSLILSYSEGIINIETAEIIQALFYLINLFISFISWITIFTILTSIFSIISIITMYLCLNDYLNKKDFSIKKNLRLSFNYFIKVFLVSFIVGLINFLGLIVLIIPGIVFSIILYYSIPIAVFENKKVFDTIKRSWEVGRNNIGFTILLYFLLFIINYAVISVAQIFSYLSLPAYYISVFILSALTSSISVLGIGFAYLKGIKK